jgi:hypothetical protein
MLEKHASLFVLATTAFSEAKWIVFQTEKAGADGPASRAQIHALGKHAIHQLRQACILSDMDDVIPQIDRLSQSFDMLLTTPEYTLDTVGQSIKHLLSRIHDELAAQYFFHLDQRDVPFYVGDRPFGSGVSERFDAATEDISEAAKCLALQRPTACVFHLMRVLELGVQTLGKRLRVKIDVRTETWHQILLHANKAVLAMPSKTSAQKKRKSAFASAAAHLQSVRLAWRNEVMHPKQTYTRQEAFDIFNASKAFMIHLADLV